MKKATMIIMGTLLLLSGCLEYRESIWLEDDLSGHMIYEFGYPEFADVRDGDMDNADILPDTSQTDGIRILSYNTYEQDDMNWIQVELEFDNILIMNYCQQDWLGTIEISDEDGNLKYSRQVTISDSMDTSEFGSALKLAMFGQYQWTYTVYFSDEIIEANTPSIRIDAQNNAVTWEYSFASVLNEMLQMDAVIDNKHFFQNTIHS